MLSANGTSRPAAHSSPNRAIYTPNGRSDTVQEGRDDYRSHRNYLPSVFSASDTTGHFLLPLSTNYAVCPIGLDHVRCQAIAAFPELAHFPYKYLRCADPHNNKARQNTTLRGASSSIFPHHNTSSITTRTLRALEAGHIPARNKFSQCLVVKESRLAGRQEARKRPSSKNRTAQRLVYR